VPQTHDLGRLFVHGFRYPMDDAPRFERGVETVEVEEPYRLGQAVSLRLWGRRALVVGWWGKEGRTEAQALYEALKASDMDIPVGAEVVGITQWRPPEPEEPDEPWSLTDLSGVTGSV
jgi:hypothetical protein